MPFPSSGCQQCKARRLKCDEAQPVCQRCAKARRVCNGARVFVVHTENPYASGQQKRPRGPRSTLKAKPASNLHIGLPRQPFDLKTEAVVYYVRCYLDSPKDAPPLLSALCAPSDLLPGRKLQLDSHLVDLAISSIALVLFSRTQQCPQAAVQASIKYQQLLQLLQVTITSLDQSNIEACLFAISYMSLYENAAYRPQQKRNTSLLMALPSLAHDGGALVILKYWKEHLSLRQPATKVVKTCRREAIKHALLGKVALPEWMKEGAAFGESGLELEYDHIITRIASLRQRLSALFQYSSSRQPGLEELTRIAEPLIQEARDIDQAFQDWNTHFPTGWSYTRHPLPTHQLCPKTSFYSPIVFSYSRLEDAAVWARYYSSRMLVLSTRLSILQLIDADRNSFCHEQSSDCMFNLQAMADALASTVPFCLERFKLANGPDSADQIITLNKTEATKPYAAVLISAPLFTVSSMVSHIDNEQKSWFGAQLAQLGRVMGVGIFEGATTEHWLDLENEYDRVNRLHCLQQST